MTLLTAMQTSSSGLAAQRLRMNVISSNIANSQTTRTPGGGPYRRRDVIFGALPAAQSFEGELRMLMDRGRADVIHVKVLGIAVDDRPPILRYDPNHPDSNDEGYVAFPNINTIEEMVGMMLANRSYEANVAAFNASKSMALRAMEIGR